jgi:hypothetical protein
MEKTASIQKIYKVRNTYKRTDILFSDFDRLKKIKIKRKPKHKNKILTFED